MILDAAGEGICRLDLNGNTTFCNPIGAEMTGYEVEELLGKSQHAVLHHSKPDGTPYPQEECPIYTAFKDGKVHHMDSEVFWRKDGTCFPVEYISRPIYEDTRLVGAVVTFKNITERKQAEDALRKAHDELQMRVEELKNFAYIVSHDLRAPLVNIKGFSEELRFALQTVQNHLNILLPHLDENGRKEVNYALGEDIPEALEFIQSSTTHMDNLIKAVLELSRLGRRRLKIGKVDMNTVVDSTLKILAHKIEQNHVKMNVELLPEINADQLSMEQMMSNLLNNAIIYLDKDRAGEIEVSGERREEETVFRVRDNGRGIVPEDQERIFEIFRRAGKQDVAGEGMGLAYARTLVRRHQGHLWCESELGKGTTFFLTIANHISESDPHE